MPLAPEDVERRLFRVLDVLDHLSMSHFLTGALVRNALAEARTSRDLDIVLDMRGRSVEAVRAAFAERGIPVEGPMKGNLGTRLVLDVEGTPVDLWLAPDTELHHREFDRARRIVYGDRELTIMDPEDYVLRKLVNWRRVRGKQSDLDDAYQVLLHAWNDIDVERLLARAAGHRVEKDARELIELVREDRTALEAGRELE